MKSNELSIPYGLEKSIKTGNVILFIGAGISKIVGLPLWGEVVQQTLKDPSVIKGDAYINALNEGIISPLEVLDKIKDTNKKEVYKKFS